MEEKRIKHQSWLRDRILKEVIAQTEADKLTNGHVV